ncbi:MAG: hypothetical protein PUB00_01540 [Clostridiales bacterium]|nr:hypothetical protein [Clostridiales bacterium]
MKATYRIFSVLMYIAMIYSTFTGIICGVMLADSKYSGFGYPIMIITLAGFAVGLVLFFVKLKWSSFFVLLGASLARVYLAYALQRQSPLESIVFYKQHLPIIAVALFSLVAVLCYKKYKKEEKGVTFYKTEKDLQLKQEKEEDLALEQEELTTEEENSVLEQEEVSEMI